MTYLQRLAGKVSTLPRQHTFDLLISRRHVKEPVKKSRVSGLKIFGELLWIKNLREPPETNQSVHRRRKIDLAERQCRREMHPTSLHRLGRCPDRISLHARRNTGLDGNDDSFFKRPV